MSKKSDDLLVKYRSWASRSIKDIYGLIEDIKKYPGLGSLIEKMEEAVNWVQKADSFVANIDPSASGLSKKQSNELNALQDEYANKFSVDQWYLTANNPGGTELTTEETRVWDQTKHEMDGIMSNPVAVDRAIALYFSRKSNTRGLL